MGAGLGVLYGAVAYVFFVATTVYSIGFVADVVVPRTVDVGPSAPPLRALMIDLALLAVFAIQHSVMARRGFKRWWAAIAPPAFERSTYVLAASLALALLLWQWRPIPSPVLWSLTDPRAVVLVQTIAAIGWVVAVVSTLLLDHWEFFGLRQVVARARKREMPEARFRTPLFYRYVRHPLYLGLLLAFWAAPFMTAGHLLFAAGATGYILVGAWFEERDLVAQFGEQYRRYREQVGMLLPRRRS